MNACRCLPGLACLALLILAGLSSAADKKDHKHPPHFEQCAKACADCMRECEQCARHCADKILAGQKEHMQTLGTCADCAEFCASAARIVSRRGPLAGPMCDACAKACDVCGAACEKFPDDPHMARCAEECRKCAKVCRLMLKQADQ